MSDSRPQLTDDVARPVRACMLAYTFYENDGRVMRYAEALASTGADVEAIALRRPGQAVEEIINGVRVLRIQEREKNETSKYQYLIRVLRFFVRSMAEITRRHLKRPFDAIHVHSVPDFEVFAALVPKMLGAKIILDIHDIVPEFYAAKFGVSYESAVFKALKLVERLSASFSDYVIVANDIWREKIVSRSARAEKCSAIINYPDLSIFRPGLRTRGQDGKFVVLFPGTLNWHQGLDIAVKAMAIAEAQAPGMELHIYGEGSARAEIQELVDKLHLGDRVFIRSPVPLREISLVMANADLGLVPKRNDSFGGEALSTKILEFMALGVPLVVADTKVERHYFDSSLLRFFVAGDEMDLARALLEAFSDREGSARFMGRALEHVQRFGWAEKKKEYVDLVYELARGPK